MDKFKEFVRLLPGFEDIDEISKCINHNEIQIADFLFSERKFVCELKTLNKVTQVKVDAIIDGLKDRPDFPVFYGDWEISKILKHLIGGDKERGWGQVANVKSRKKYSE